MTSQDQQEIESIIMNVAYTPNNNRLLDLISMLFLLLLLLMISYGLYEGIRILRMKKRSS